MSTHESDMDFDSGVSDMTGSESVCSEISDTTIIASPPSSIIDGDLGHTESDSGVLENSMIQEQMLQGSASSSLDSGIGSVSGTKPTFAVPFPVNHGDSTMSHQHRLNTGTKQTPGSQSSRDSVLSPDSGKGNSVLSPDSGIGSVSGRRSNVDTHLPPKGHVDSTPRTQEWINTSPFEVFVKTLEGKTVTITVEEDEPVTSLRAKIQQKTNVPESQQYLHTAEGRKLNDGERISAYNIKKHSTIYCQGRLRGGWTI